MKPDDEICYCYHVSLRKLWNFARREKPRRASQLCECLSAGTGCGWCIPILKRIQQQAGVAGHPLPGEIPPGEIPPGETPPGVSPAPAPAAEAAGPTKIDAEPASPAGADPSGVDSSASLSELTPEEYARQRAHYIKSGQPRNKF